MAQVCDRCRVKRVKCDGRQPKCDKCDRVGVECTTSTQLRRKTTPRGYIEPTRETIQQLRDELQKARDQVRSVSAQAEELGATVARQNEELERLEHLRSNVSSVPSSHKRSSQGPVVGHLGRLVLGDSNADFFAGSTTGVHFILSAQQQYQRRFQSPDHFPEGVFRLHVLRVCDGRARMRPSEPDLQFLNLPNFEYDFLSQQDPTSFETVFDRFQHCWGMLYPALLSKQFFTALGQLFQGIRASSDVSLLLQAYALLALDAFSNHSPDLDILHHTLTQPQYDRILSDLFGRMPSRGDLTTLQALLLYLLYLQSTSQHSLGLRICGMAVRLAQSLGLHRHSRRFRHALGETELRKRLWWCVYILDVQSSVLFGLPRTIQHADVDVDLPINADFDDLHCEQLSYPLPGQTTHVEPFIHYIQLSHLLSRCLQQMYTTTDRRGATGKIQRLQRELDVWGQNVQASQSDIALIEEIEKNGLEETSGYISLWLSLLEQFTSILIHRPALTFSPEEPQFVESLGICVESATKIIVCFRNGRGQHLLPQMWPFGYHLVFQSALMLLYNCWVRGPQDAPASQSSVNLATLLDLMKPVQIAIELLRPQSTTAHDIASTPGNLNSGLSPEAIAELSQTSSFLQHLHDQSLRTDSRTIEQLLPFAQSPGMPIPHCFFASSPAQTPRSFDYSSMLDPMRIAAATWTPFSIGEVNQMEPFEFTDSFLVPWGD